MPWRLYKSRCRLAPVRNPKIQCVYFIIMINSQERIYAIFQTHSYSTHSLIPFGHSFLLSSLLLTATCVKPYSTLCTEILALWIGLRLFSQSARYILSLFYYTLSSLLCYSHYFIVPTDGAASYCVLPNNQVRPSVSPHC